MKNLNHKMWVSLGVLLLSFFSLQTSHLEAKDLKDKVKKGIENTADSLKKEIDKLADGVEAAQEYLDHYNWKGIIQDKASSGVATLKHMKLNGHSRATAVKPGEEIEGEVECFLDPEKCSKLSLYRVVVGIKGIGPQASLCNYMGAVAGKSVEKFKINAPQSKGVYEIRFRVAEHMLESDAFKEWVDDQCNEPDASTTVGIIIVK